MNIKDNNYSKFALVREMLETASIIRNFDPEVSGRFAKSLKSHKGLFLTGEGSSRIFPARRAIYSSMKKKFTLPILTDGCTQAMEYNLEDFTVFAASNSGQTKEVIRMVIDLKKKNHTALFGLTANKNTKLQELAADTHILSCGKEIILDELQKKLHEYRTQLYRADSVTQLNILNSGLMIDVDKLQKAGIEYIERSIKKFRGKV